MLVVGPPDLLDDLVLRRVIFLVFAWVCFVLSSPDRRPQREDRQKPRRRTGEP